MTANDLSILIATDVAADVDIIRKSLSNEFAVVHVTSDPARSVGDFDARRPDVVILAFDKVAKAEQFYLGLFRQSSVIGDKPHRTILLCTKEEVREAYSLCRRDCFDDYVLYWPMTFDHPRLAMSVRLGMRALEHASAAPATRKLLEAAREAAAVEPILDSLISKGDRHLVAAHDGITSMAQGIGDAVQDFSVSLTEQLTRMNAGSSVVGDVKRRLQALHKDHLEPRLRAAGSMLTPARDCYAAMSNAYRPRMATVRKAVSEHDAGLQSILIVEDEATQRRLYEQLLDRRRFALSFAGTGAEALRMAAKSAPDLVLMDVMLPDLNGVEITRRLKSIERLAAVPVVIITGHSERSVVVQSLEAGALDFLVKPFTAQALTQKVEHYLGDVAATDGGGMSEPIRILLVEDAVIDAELTSRVLKKAGIVHLIERVDTEPAFMSALQAFTPDIVLSDYSMPHFDGLSVLVLVQQHAPDLPFIFVSGTIGEEVAIDSLKRGATDYIIKTNMARLPAAVTRALDDTRDRVARHHTQRALREAQERFALFMQHLPGPAFIKDLAGRLQFVNAAFERMADMESQELIGRTDHELWPDRAESYVSNDRWVLTNNRVLQAFETCPQQDGAHRYFVHKFPIPDGAGRPGLIGGVAVDFTARLLAEEKLARLSRIHTFLSGINSAIVRTQDKLELLQDACRIAVEHGGFNLAWIALLDATGEPRVMAAEGADVANISARLAAGVEASREAGIAAGVMERNDPVVAERRAHGASGPTGPGDRYAAAGLPIRVDGALAGVLVLYASQAQVFDEDEMKLLAELAGDISFALEYLAKKERLDYFAYYDPLTGLPNRALYEDRLDQSVQSHASGALKTAVVVLDIERFSMINESFGRQAGDALLKLFARRLHDTLGPTATAARVGANAFALMLADLREGAEAARILKERVHAAMEAAFTVNGRELTVAFKTGVALFPNDGTDAESLLRNAESALKNAKASGDRYLFYAAPMNARVVEILSLENELRAALAQEQFVLHYQPKIELATSSIYGLEALVRWNSPQRGLVSPAEFMPIVEETGMILELGRWVMRQAARDLLRWRQRMPGTLRMSVNVSSLQLRQKAFVDEALETIREAGADPADFDLEITETVIMEDIGQFIPKLCALRDVGMGIEIDDFGTGYSSLAYLAKLPVSTLKIDRSFVTAMMQTASDRTIISTIISLAHLLELSVVAEGVETQAQRDLLQALGCDRMQGFLFCRPIPADAIDALLAERYELGGRLTASQ